MALVARMRTCGTVHAHSHQADEPPLVDGQLCVLLVEHPAVVRIVLDEKNSEDERETTGIEEGYEVRRSRQERGAGRGST